jgi:hypothetical protein
MLDKSCDKLTAEQVAHRLVERSDGCRWRHFSVIDEYKPVPFPTHWRRKNTSGVTFRRQDAAAAQAWVKQALLAGFTVFHARTKNGLWAGQGLKDGRVAR